MDRQEINLISAVNNSPTQSSASQNRFYVVFGELKIRGRSSADPGAAGQRGTRPNKGAGASGAARPAAEGCATEGGRAERSAALPRRAAPAAPHGPAPPATPPPPGRGEGPAPPGEGAGGPRCPPAAHTWSGAAQGPASVRRAPAAHSRALPAAPDRPRPPPRRRQRAAAQPARKLLPGDAGSGGAALRGPAALPYPYPYPRLIPYPYPILTLRLHLLPPPRSGAPRAAASWAGRRAGLSGYKGGRRARGVGFLSLPLQLHRAMRRRERDEAPPKAAEAGGAPGASAASRPPRRGPGGERDPRAGRGRLPCGQVQLPARGRRGRGAPHGSALHCGPRAPLQASGRGWRPDPDGTPSP